ncbi:MAG: DsrE/DsrF/DrsH-like family protein [Magnetococcales bacterium]|nr:DsrE/DsrF/DrsH-like family protein [Magnetococcales bacterium]MBF0114957.1 DsrE/DsrF/DrsH-like family protein [Magnetococcales bacterium]
MNGEKKMAIIATQGTLDWAYPPLILATTAAALDYQVSMFYTFYGLQVLRKNLDLRLSPMGNPAMPMPVSLPVLMQALPGMEAMATAIMRKKLTKRGVASVRTLRDMALESEVRIIACQMTVDLFAFRREDLIDGIVFAGATAFMEAAAKANITLYT